MEREIFDQLIAWKNNPKRKPLILMGARQVGKTHSLQAFGASEYDNVAYINFEEQKAIRRLFESSIKPEMIVKALAVELELDIEPGKTLIIFDEVQECPDALNSLKYFNESANEYHVCAAGSLLGVKLVHSKGFPVGKVNFMHLYPMGFREFLCAIGQTRLYDFMESISRVEPLPSNVHEKLLYFYKIYYFVGGMPEAVAEYADSEDFSRVTSIHQEILKAYSLDFAKHAPQEHVMKINQVWNAIPTQLAKENKKFIYSVIRKGARAKEFEVALQWLLEAGLIHKVYNISMAKLPISAYANFEFFKIYLVDVGLLGMMNKLSAKTVIHDVEIFKQFRGSLTENVVMQVLARLGYDLYYWTSEGKAEVDFVLQHEEAIYPIEVKSGNTGRKKSLQVYNQKYSPELSIRVSPQNLKLDGQLFNCPLYLIGKLPYLIDLIN